jgi:hypothetical protein
MDPVSWHGVSVAGVSNPIAIHLVVSLLLSMPTQISDEEELTIIDFPQMISVSHANAQEYFERDVECIVR